MELVDENAESSINEMLEENQNRLDIATLHSVQ
jgi:hypothetical protein